MKPPTSHGHVHVWLTKNGTMNAPRHEAPTISASFNLLTPPSPTPRRAQGAQAGQSGRITV